MESDNRDNRTPVFFPGYFGSSNNGLKQLGFSEGNGQLSLEDCLTLLKNTFRLANERHMQTGFCQEKLQPMKGKQHTQIYVTRTKIVFLQEEKTRTIRALEIKCELVLGASDVFSDFWVPTHHHAVC